MVMPSRTLRKPSWRQRDHAVVRRRSCGGRRSLGSATMASRSSSLTTSSSWTPIRPLKPGVAAAPAADALVERVELVAHPLQRLAHGPRRFVGLRGTSEQIRRTSRWASTMFSAAPIRYGSTPMLTSRVMAEQASLVCSVLKTRWPVSAA